MAKGTPRYGVQPQVTKPIGGEEMKEIQLGVDLELLIELADLCWALFSRRQPKNIFG